MNCKSWALLKMLLSGPHPASRGVCLGRTEESALTSSQVMGFCLHQGRGCKDVAPRSWEIQGRTFPCNPTHKLALQVKCPLAFVSLHVKLPGDGIHTKVSLTLASLSYPQGGWGPGWGWAQEGTGSELRSVHSKA